MVTPTREHPVSSLHASSRARGEGWGKWEFEGRGGGGGGKNLLSASDYLPVQYELLANLKPDSFDGGTPRMSIAIFWPICFITCRKILSVMLAAALIYEHISIEK